MVSSSSWKMEVNYLKCFFFKFQTFSRMLTAVVLTSDFTSIYARERWELKIDKYIVLRRCLGTCIIFDNRPTLRLSLFPRFDRYLFQCKSSCSISPKYLTWFVGLIFWSLSRKLRCLVIVLFLGLNIIISVLLAFKENFICSYPLYS